MSSTSKNPGLSKGSGFALVSELSAFFPGLIAGVAAKDANSINYENDFDTIRRHEIEAISAYTACDSRNIIFLDQVHSDNILTVDRYPEIVCKIHGQADAVVTRLPDICPVIRTADCVPVIIHDPVKNVLAAVHSGWRSTELNITGKTIETMQNNYGSSPADLYAAVLPSAGPQSYEVSYDVASKFPAECVTMESESIFLDLWKCVRMSLCSTGVPVANIFESRICTISSNASFFSYRMGDKGRNLNFACMKKPAC